MSPTYGRFSASIPAEHPEDAVQRQNLIARLQFIVGHRYVLTGSAKTQRYVQGFRFGAGAAIAVVQPGSLVEQWRVVLACVTANAIVIMQAANTGLTGGSSPHGKYDRDVVVISTKRIADVHVIDEGRQVVCLPGATLYELERQLRPLGREPHSVIGSSCIGASVLGGVCNNSGGALVRRGPAFTQLALFARVDADGVLHLVNHLGINLPEDPEEALAAVEARGFSDADISHDVAKRASDAEYAEHVRQIEDPTPARFNADPSRLYEASGSAGHLALFAVRLDTFEKDSDTAVFYIGTNNPAELTTIRRDILGTFECLPVAGEYMHRTAFDIAEVYGKDTFLAITHFGTERLPRFFDLKARFDRVASYLPLARDGLSDRLLQQLSKLFPRHLPKRMTDYRDRYQHHLMLRMAGSGIDAARRYLTAKFPSADGAYFECTSDEGNKAFLHRFAVAGAAVRYRAVHADVVGDIVALDIALPRNERDWFEVLPADLERSILHKLYYGHFFCHVFHQDYIVAKGSDALALEHRMWALLDERGAEYPAEHNVGHIYQAKPALAAFYRKLDPLNQFNPGLGHTSRRKHWQ